MLEALNRVSIFVENNSKKVFLELKEDGIMASGETSDVGDAKEIISCEYSGEDVNITFNNAFLVTLVGSTIPASIISTYLFSKASYP